MNIQKLREEAKKKRRLEAGFAPLRLKAALEKFKSTPKQSPKPRRGKPYFEKIEEYKFFRKFENSLLDEIKSGSVSKEAARQRFESLLNEREKARVISTAMKQKILTSSALMKDVGP